ncbi:hypothetical protein IFM89_014329 [Coptis chinensis]|uniref:Uncharacterized protein n=1 Tax=Coptis chinensis TaxID=261450 RepID=A0A835LZJ0_9MAGN|nr:hypothetical protein IFM89_014329 [Coptis chinensis]
MREREGEFGAKKRRETDDSQTETNETTFWATPPPFAQNVRSAHLINQFFSPLGMVPVIALVGFGLFDRAFPLVGSCVEIGVPMLILFVAFSQSTGAYKAASRLASATPPPAHGLSRGIGWQRECGSSWIHSSWESKGGSNLSWFYDIFLYLGLGKFGALFRQYQYPFSLLFTVFCSDLLHLWGCHFLQFTNMNSMRNLFIVGVAFFLGLSVPEYFREYTASTFHSPAHTKAGWFNDFLNTIFFSSPTVALIVAVFPDNTLQYKDSSRDRGIPWWQRFRTFKGDSRNEEFYTLPFNLNHFFPPRFHAY